MFVPGSNAINSANNAFGFPITNDAQNVDLAAVRNARGDINEIRLLLKGNVETCHKLFRQAVAEGDAIAQIQLSHALSGMKRGKDQDKDFSSLTAVDLEKFSYYPREFTLFTSAYEEAMGLEFDWEQSKARGIETFSQAAAHGHLPAILELKHTSWKLNADSYGFAVQLRPYVGQGDQRLDYYFGKALKNGCQIGSERYYEGLYCMEQSGGITVKYQEESQTFDSFKSYYTSYEDFGHTYYYDCDGFMHVLVPSRAVWETFKREKLTGVQIAPVESYMFAHDAEQIKSLVNQYKISVVRCFSFVEHPTIGRKITSWRGESLHGFRKDTLSVYEDHKKIGEISVQEDTFAICETINEPKIQPVIDFIENVMKRTGSAGSAHAWLRQMGSRYI